MAGLGGNSAQDQQPLAVTAVLSVLRTAAWLLEELEPVFAAHHTTAARFDVLDVLAQLDRPVRPVELKQRLHVPGQTLTGVLDALERQGLVRRLPNPTDRRSVLIQITEAGRTAFADLCPELIAVEEACLAGLSALEVQRLVKTLGGVQRAISQRHTHGTPPVH
jgi:DNA-binding MarR family transcriptional regulator